MTYRVAVWCVGWLGALKGWGPAVVDSESVSGHGYGRAFHMLRRLYAGHWAVRITQSARCMLKIVFLQMCTTAMGSSLIPDVLGRVWLCLVH